MKPSLLLTALALLLTSGGCRKEDPRPVSTSLFGEWQWVSSIGGFSGKEVVTPATTGVERTYRFTRDSSFVECLNGQCTVPFRFTTRLERSFLTGTQRQILTLHRRFYLAPPDTGFHVLKARYHIEEVSNELHIAQDRPDGFGEYYKRK